MNVNKTPPPRAERRKMIRRIDKALLDVYSDYTRLVMWWRGLDKEKQEKIKTSTKPPKDYVKLAELHKTVASLLRDRRILKGESKHVRGIENTIRRHRH